MFTSGGYFRGLNCPFFSNGLCERPYCHFRHVKYDEDKVPSKSQSSTYADTVVINKYTGQPEPVSKPVYEIEGANTIVDGSKNVNKYTGEPLTMTRRSEYCVEPVGTDYKKYKPSQKSALKTGTQNPTLQINKYTGEPIIEEVNKNKYAPEGGNFPEYNPTPINKLKTSSNVREVGHLKTQHNGDEKSVSSKYSMKNGENTTSEQEYDPESNFSTSLLVQPTQPLAIKRTYSYDPTTPNFCHPAKKAKNSDFDKDVTEIFGEESDEGECGMFSDDEEEEVKQEVPEEESDDDSEKEDEDDMKLPLITDVKVFESLLMPVMDHDNVKEKDKHEKSLSGEKLAGKNEKTRSDCEKNNEKLNKKVSTSQNRHSSSQKSSSTTEIVKLSSSSSKEKSSHNDKSKESQSKSSEKSKSSKSSSKSSSSSSKSTSSSKEKISQKSHAEKSSSKSDMEKFSSERDKKSSKHSSSEKISKEQNSSKSSHSHQSKHHSSSKGSSSSSSKTSSSKSEKSSSSEKHSKSHEKHKDKKTESANHKNHLSDIKHESKSVKSKHSHSDHKKHESHLSKDLKDTHKHSDSSKNKKEKDSKSRSSRSISQESNSSRRSIVDINLDLFGEDSDNDDVPPLYGDSDLEEDEYNECLKIFNQNDVTRPSPKKCSPVKKAEETEVAENMVGKKRTAHKNSTEVKRRIPEKPHSKLSPAQIMHNRFLQMQKQAQEESSHQNGQSSSTSESSSKKRVAHNSHSDTGTKVVDGKTVVTTASKSQKRKAHTPNVPNLKRPTIPAEFGSKVPVNVRQRYLNTIIDECLHLYDNEEDAYKRGLEEETAVYNRASNKTLYLNVACNTIKRLRTEVLEATGPPSKKLSPMKTSHEAVLGGKNATKSTFTLNRSGGCRGQIENFKGCDLYKRLMRYILTEEQLKENGFPRTDPENPSQVKFYTTSRGQQNSAKLKMYEKICVRCGKRFMVYPNGTYANKEECSYHWGKAWKKKIAGYIETRYTCCQGDLGADGCQVAMLHVHEANKWENLTGYMKTLPCSPSPDGDYGVYAMDCEMVYTQGGVELARVTVTDSDNTSVYETLVRPDRKVIDYNTRFSGITEEDLEGVRTTLRDVQAVLLSLFTDKTIIIGHSLESDLAAVKIIHNTVVDTSVVFPHRLGPPYKRALKTLMAEILQKIIQDDVEGHDSKEDATSCMDLMHWRVKEDAKKEPRHS